MLRVHTWHVRLSHFVLLLLLLVGAGSHARAGTAPGSWVILPGQEATLQSLIVSSQGPESDYVFTDIRVESQRVVFELKRRQGDQFTPAGTMVLRHISEARADDMRGEFVAVQVQLLTKDVGAQSFLRQAQQRVVKADPPHVFIRLEVSEPHHAERPPSPSDEAADSAWFWGIQTGLGLLLFLLVSLGLLARWRRWPVRWVVKRSHVLPMALQFIIFAYWALYWSDTQQILGIVAAQVLFAGLLEGALGLWKEREWRLGMGPFPIVFSVNLFVWYRGSEIWCGFAIIAIALFAKAFIQRQGRHIFNPSALGISVLGLGYMVELAFVGWGNTSIFTFVDVSHPLNAAPNMTELILLLGLVPQRRFPIVLVSLAALVSMLILGDSFEGLNPLAWMTYRPLHPLWPPVFLALVLLATDPSTIPKTQNGRVLFGLALGLLITLGSSAANGLGSDDYFTKVMPIPLINLLAWRFDRWGERFSRRISALFDARHNARHIACFVLLSGGGLWATDLKREAQTHAHYAPGDRVRKLDLSQATDRCVLNKPWCEPFSMVDEVKLWTSP